MGAMTILGGAGEAMAAAGIGSVSRSTWMKHLGTAITGASGAAVVLGGYEVLTAQPERAFTLLQGWGPTFLITIVGLFLIGKFLDGIVGRFLDGLNSTVRESFNVMAVNAKASADAAAKTALALTQLAEQGNHQAEETRRLAIYAAQEFIPLYERLDKQDQTLNEIASGMKVIHRLLDQEKAALTKKEKEEEVNDGH